MARKIVKGPVIRPAGGYGTFKNKGKNKTKLTATLRNTTVKPAQLPEAIPAKLAGKYAVWSPDGLRIVGSGPTIGEALAIAALEDGRLVQRVPAEIRARSLGGTKSTPIDG